MYEKFRYNIALKFYSQLNYRFYWQYTYISRRVEMIPKPRLLCKKPLRTVNYETKIEIVENMEYFCFEECTFTEKIAYHP